MPGYGGKRMEIYTPIPTEEAPTLEKRFKMPEFPRLTIVQMVIVAMLIAYAWTARKVKYSVVGTAGLAVALLHMYDHMYRVKRGPERLFFLPKKEGYCGACRK
jgi:hypothetical protein